MVGLQGGAVVAGGGQLAPVVGLQGGGMTAGGFTGTQLTNPAALARQLLS